MTKNKTLNSVMIIFNLNNIPFDPASVVHKYNIESKEINSVLIQKISKDLGMKCKSAKKNRINFEKTPLPCLAKNKDGSFFVIAKANNEKILVYNAEENKSSTLSYDDFYSIYDNEILLFKPQNNEIKNMKFNVKWFIPTITKYKTQFIQVLVASFTIQLLGVFTPIIMQVIIDKVLVHRSMYTLNTIMILLVIVTLFELILGIAKNYVFTDTTSKIDVTLGARLFEHLLSLPLSYFESRRTGDTIAKVRELDNIRRFLTGTPLSTIIDLFFIVVYLFVMFFYSKELTMIVILTLPIFAIISFLYTPIFRKNLDDKFSAGAESQSFLVETVSGISTVKSISLEPKMRDRWDNILVRNTRAGYKLSILSGNLNAIISFIQKLVNLVILWYGVQLVIAGKLTVGQFIAFRMLAGNVTQPILRITGLWQEIQQSSISIDRIGDIFNAKPEMESTGQTRLPKIEGDIAFEGVSFRYGNDKPEVIKNISFEINKGEVVGFVGRSGSGKSTVSKLIQRLYFPTSGKITVDKVDISIVDSNWLRSQIGIVMQESFLFNRSIRDNIAINKPTATIEEIVYACNIAGAHEFIVSLPMAYDTMIGENGTGLSGGQKQRIAIARAIIGNPRILIFDEATSALDYESEKIIQDNIDLICKGRTVIMIAHRLSTLKNADKIIVMEKGEIVEEGPPKELLEKDGLYRHLYNQQFESVGEKDV